MSQFAPFRQEGIDWEVRARCFLHPAPERLFNP